MPAETQTLSTKFALSIPGSFLPQGYFRSKLFIAPYSTNPIIAAAGPLFSLLERLTISPSLPAMKSIHHNIEHELKSFHSKLKVGNYSEELSTIAHFLLCATIDELLGKSYLKIYGQSAEFKAFSPVTYDEVEPQKRFFDILKHIKERPTQYLDVIELAYYCLIAGFEGEHHAQADGRMTLDDIIEELFLLIQKHRVNKPYKLYNEHSSPKPEPRPKKNLVYIAIVSIGLLISSFIFSNLYLQNKVNTVRFGHFKHANWDHS